MQVWDVSFLRRAAGFTLIELLVVILIIGILIAVSAPSFLGQTQKAHDSEAKQYLTIAYKAAKASATDRDGQFVAGSFTAANLATAIHDSEPALTVATGTCPTSADTNPKHIFVGAGTAGDSLELCNDPSHTVWILTVTHNGPPVISSTVLNSSSGSGGGTQVGGTTPQAGVFPGNISYPQNHYDATHLYFTTLVDQGTGDGEIQEWSDPGTAPSGWSFMPQAFRFSGPAAPSDTSQAATEIDITYRVSQYPAGQDNSTVLPFLNGQAVPTCTGVDSLHNPIPDPCYAGALGNGSIGDGGPLVYTRHALSLSDLWTVGYQANCGGTVQAMGEVAFASTRDSGINGHNLLWTMDTNGGNQHAVAANCLGDSYFKPSFAADGSKYVVEGQHGSAIHTYVASSSGGTLTTLDASLPTNQSWAVGGAPSPDGSKVAYLRLTLATNHYDLVVADPDGSNVQVIGDPGINWATTGVLWLTNNRILAKGMDLSTSTYGLYSMDATGGTLQLLFSGQPSDLALAPNGNELAYGTPDGAIHVYDLTTDQDTNLTAASNDATLYEWEPAWSPDSSKIALISTYGNSDQNGGGVILRDASDGSFIRALTTEGTLDNGLYADTVVWSAADPSNVLYSSNLVDPNVNQVYSVPFAGGSSTALTTANGFNVVAKP
jgi:prepilin-type N-terminal cleavage/methylation domain-containing protein